MPARPFQIALGIMALVVLSVFAMLVGAGELEILPAAMGAGVILLVGGVLLHLQLDGVGALRDGVDRLAEAPDEAPPQIPTSNPGIKTIWRTILRLVRLWRDRLQQVEADLASSDTVLLALPDPFILLNDRREVVRVNAAARELFGAQLIGRDLAAALRNPAVLNATDAVLKGGDARIIEFELSLPIDRTMRARIEPLPDRAVDRYAALVTLTDLTAMKRTEQMRADFVANASHELRTPLSTLIGFIETLQGPASDDHEAQKRFLSIMQQQAGRMARLVDDLLSLSRIELNEHLPPTQHAQISGLLRTVVTMLELKAAARCMRIALDVPAELPPIVGDPEELAQVFQNLVDNAIKYARPDTEITVSAGPSAKLRPGVAIVVRDRGEGIPRLHLPRLTERFYRVDTARSREMGGTGLGLAIVKHIVSRHRGLLDIDSEMGEGSTFTIHLRAVVPIRSAETDGPPSLAPKPALKG
ncbi:MAG TPA: ATP-binding protein [Aliidongia sp.]|nr:ATP-binding protein [Aliidongia sp.]